MGPEITFLRFLFHQWTNAFGFQGSPEEYLGFRWLVVGVELSSVIISSDYLELPACTCPLVFWANECVSQLNKFPNKLFCSVSTIGIGANCPDIPMREGTCWFLIASKVPGKALNGVPAINKRDSCTSERNFGMRQPGSIFHEATERKEYKWQLHQMLHSAEKENKSASSLSDWDGKCVMEWQGTSKARPDCAVPWIRR